MRTIKIEKNITDISFILEKYQNDVRNSRPLTPDEEFETFEKYRKGDLESKNKIIFANLRFVISCAKKYIGCGLPIEDLINEGNIGLIKAVERFDHTSGFKFISYAVSWIRQSILLALSEDSRTVYLPGTITSKLTKVKEEINKMELTHGYYDMHEILDKVKLKKDILSINDSSAVVSTDKTIDDDNEITLGELLKSDDTTDSDDMNQYLKKIMSVLTNEELEIVKLTYGFPPYLMPHKPEMIVNETRTLRMVKQTLNRALKKLKEVSKYEYV
jgi:RNA polymerase primary sigma factor